MKHCHVALINGCLQFVKLPPESRSGPSETCLSSLHKTALGSANRSSDGHFSPLTVVYVTHMLEGWGKETRSLGYDLSEREVITDPVMSEERQPDVSSAIKYSNVGEGLCDLP